MNGYEFCKKILEHPKGGVAKLMEFAKDTECEWLEFKAGVSLSPADKEQGGSQQDLYWSIANAVICMMNTYGGAVIIGIDDETHSRVPLENNDPRHVIKRAGTEAYLRTEIYDKIWDAGGGQTKNWGTKGNFHSIIPLPNLVEMKAAQYQGGKVAVILVQPSLPKCFRVWKDQVEEIRIRSLGEIGKTREIIGAENMAEYEQNQRKIDVPAPGLEAIYEDFLEEADKEKRQLRRRKRFWCGVVVALLLGMIFFGVFGLSIFRSPVEVPSGETHPDEIVVKHPLWTIEWACLDWEICWENSDTIKVGYGSGQWKLQRNKLFGNFRILDPRRIMRSWGSQKEMLEVFEDVKKQLKSNQRNTDATLQNHKSVE